MFHDGTKDRRLELLPLARGLVMVMKSVPKNTPVTPGTPNRRSASGDCAASFLSRMSNVPVASTVRPGRNLRVAGLGVASVWMNMGWLPAPAARSNRYLKHSNTWRFVLKVQDAVD
jgi:hypothetical protein